MNGMYVTKQEEKEKVHTIGRHTGTTNKGHPKAGTPATLR